VPVPVETAEEWSRWLDRVPDELRIVGKAEIGHYRVSTVFMGLCHQFNPNDDRPILFETMVLDHREGLDETGVIPTRRESTWEGAEIDHIEVCKEVRALAYG